MASWPKQAYRKTKHTPPRYQLYQPGFNEHNGCWLQGSWITVSKEEWGTRKGEHDRMYKTIRKKEKNQYHRGKGVKRKDMTPAQRQAWEHYSGTGTFEAIWPDGRIGSLGVDMAGTKLSSASEQWLRKEGAKLFRWVLRPGRKRKAVNQLAGFNLPEDLVHTKEGTTKDNAVDTVQHIVDQNMQAMEDMFEQFLDCAPEGLFYGEKTEESFGGRMIFHSLVEQEETLLRIEWDESQGREDLFTTLEKETQRYVKMRARAKDKCGDEAVFLQWLENARKNHNECARENLDNSDGQLFAFVLPKFNDDGTHEPWGERDVPWNAGDF